MFQLTHVPLLVKQNMVDNFRVQFRFSDYNIYELIKAHTNLGFSLKMNSYLSISFFSASIPCPDDAWRIFDCSKHKH